MEETIELREIIEIILQGKWIIAITTVLCMLFAGIVSWFILPEKYESVAVVQVSSNVEDKGIVTNYIATEFTPQVFSQRIKDQTIMNSAFEKEDIKNNFFIDNLSVISDVNTNLINLTYSSDSRENAQKELQTIISVTKNEMNESVKLTLQNLENAYNTQTQTLAEEIEILINDYNKIIRNNNLPELLILQTVLNSEIVLNITEEQTKALTNVNGALQNQLLQLQSQIQTKSEEYRNVLTNYQSVKTGLESFKPEFFVNVISKPTLAEEPTSPNNIINLAIGLVLGMIIGLVLVFFRYYWRNSAKVL